MNKDLKILAINNVTFKKPLESKEAFKKRNHPLTHYVINDINHIKNYALIQWKGLLRKFGNIASLLLLRELLHGFLNKYVNSAHLERRFL